MIGYMDITFCSYYTDCKKQKKCMRPLTSSVIQAAQRWWGGDDPPIIQFAEKPDCHESD